MIILGGIEILIVLRLHVTIAIFCGGRVPSGKGFGPGLKGRVERGEDAFIATFAEMSDAARCTKGLVGTEPNPFTDVMAMLEIFDPPRTGLEALVGNLEAPRSLLGFIANEGVRQKGVLLLHLDEPADELFFDLGEFGRAAQALTGSRMGKGRLTDAWRHACHRPRGHSSISFCV